MNKIILSILILFAAFSASAQPVASEGKVEYQKGDKAAAVIELPYSPDVVSNAIKENLNKQGIKEEKLKGYQVFKGVKLNDYDSEVVDLYFKVDKKSRKDKNNSVVSMIIGRPNENVALRTTDDTHRISDGKDFLNSLIPAVEEKNLEVNISEQDATVNKSQKKLRKLEDQQKNLERKIRNLEDKLAENKKDQESENEELNKQRSMKEAMQGRRSDSQ